LIIVLRGRRLITDAERGGTGTLARTAMGVFRLLFRLNVDASPWGWQTLAQAQLSPHAA